MMAGPRLLELYVCRDEFDVAVAVVVVDLRFVSDVEALLLQQLLLEVSHAEANAADGSGLVGDGELEMIAFGADASG
jgi:hypothetical protein